MSLFVKKPADKSARGFDRAVACSPLRQIPAFPGAASSTGAEQYYYEQEYLQHYTSFAPLALNSAHPNNRSIFLVEEGTPQDAGAGLRRWTRIYAPIFGTWSEYQDGEYTMPSIVIGALNYDFLPKKVCVRIEHAYFMLGMSMQDGDPYKDTDARLADHTNVLIQTPSQILRRYPKSFFDVNGVALGNSCIGAVETLVEDIDGGDRYYSWPELTFKQMLRDGNEIVVEESSVYRWKGNLFCRETKYVKLLIW